MRWMVQCPNCGAANVEGATQCQNCGEPLSTLTAPAPVYYPQTPFDRSFRGAGPLLKAFIGFILVLLIVEVLQALSGSSTFAERFGEFLDSNLLLIFLILLLAAYSGYSSRRYHRYYPYVSPLVAAIIITFVLWLVANMLGILGSSHDVDELETMGDLLFSILYIIFLLVLLIGYIGVVMRANRPEPPRMVPSYPVPDLPRPTGAPASPQPVPGPRRLVRSDRNRILFGVCGGMADYFDIDPFLIRVLWVVGALVSLGAFVLAYLIMAILLPKGP